MKKNLAVSTCVFALIALSAFTSHAADGSARTDILVTATVSSSCVIDAQNVVFGEYIPTAKEAIKAEGLIRLTCVKGSAPVVSIGGGANHNGTNRRAAYISQNSTDQSQIEYLNYELYQPESNNPGSLCSTSAIKKIWASTTDTSNPDNTNTFATTAAPSNTVREYKICGFMKEGQDVSAGTYKDNVTITASF